MRKFRYILPAILLLAAVSCGKETGVNSGPGGAGNSEVRFPSGSSYGIGDDVVIICSGISSGASFFLVSADGTQTPVDNVTVTGSGIFFTIETAPGEYSVVVEQDGERFELGRITVTETVTDVIISSVPDYCLPGESFTVYGTGFMSSAELYIEDSEGNRTRLTDITVGSGEMTVNVPENAPRGKFTLVISQGEKETEASTAFFITSRKQLVKVIYDIAPGTLFNHTYELNATGRDENGNVTGFSEYAMTSASGSDSDGNYTEYSFTPANEDFGYSDFRMKVRDKHVVSVTFETTQSGIEDYYTFDWRYSNEGYLSYAVSNGSGLGTVWLETSDDNICFQDNSVACEYGDPDLVNNPFAADFVISVLGTECEIFRVAQVMGLTGNVSRNLPTRLDDSAVTYTYDDEGYVTGASFNDPATAFAVELEYVYE